MDGFEGLALFLQEGLSHHIGDFVKGQRDPHSARLEAQKPLPARTPKGKGQRVKTHSFDMLAETLHVESSIASVPSRTVPRPDERISSGIRSRNISPNCPTNPVQMTVYLTLYVRDVRACHRSRPVLTKEIIQERFFGSRCRRRRRRNPVPIVTPRAVMVMMVGRRRRSRIPRGLRMV